MVGVILPILNAFLKEANWRYDAIGLATAAAGLGTLLFQAPAGWLTDKLTCRRALFAGDGADHGACFALIPLVPRTPGWVDSLLFVSGATQSFFGPVLGALALASGGTSISEPRDGVEPELEPCRKYRGGSDCDGAGLHAGLTSIFYSVGVCSVLAGASVLLIREQDLNERRGYRVPMEGEEQARAQWTYLLKDKTVRFLLLSIFLFHLANAPILPTVALYVKKLGGSDNWMTATVLTAQVVMVPVALLAGRFCDSWGRKPVMAIAFWVLPVRIAVVRLRPDAMALVYLQGLDGIGAGFMVWRWLR